LELLICLPLYNIKINVVNLAGSGKKLTKSTDKIHIKSELTKRSLQNN